MSAKHWIASGGATLVADGRVSLDVDERTRDEDIASVETTVKYDGYLKQEVQVVRWAGIFWLKRPAGWSSCRVVVLWLGAGPRPARSGPRWRDGVQWCDRADDNNRAVMSTMGMTRS